MELVELQRHHRLLTPREGEVLPFVVAAFANQQTAGELGSSESPSAEPIRIADKLGLAHPSGLL